MAESNPLCWPVGWKRTAYRRKCPFKVSNFGSARDFLLAELRRLGATNIVLSSNMMLRRDGLPYSNQKQPEDPGIAIYFTYKKRQMSLACDVYKNTQENCHAIARTIEAIRGIERWGASDMMERAFYGFSQLPATTERDWWEVLGLPRSTSRDVVEGRYRLLAQERHPDKGGSHTAMAELNIAREKALKELR